MKKLLIIVVLIAIFLTVVSCCPRDSIWTATYVKGDKHLFRTGQGCACPGILGYKMTSCILNKPIWERWK